MQINIDYIILILSISISFLWPYLSYLTSKKYDKYVNYITKQRLRRITMHYEHNCDKRKERLKPYEDKIKELRNIISQYIDEYKNCKKNDIEIINEINKINLEINTYEQLIKKYDKTTYIEKFCEKMFFKRLLFNLLAYLLFFIGIASTVLSIYQIAKLMR